MNLERTILNDIISLAQKCAIEKVVLFGSRARGDHHPRSDIDLAIQGGDTVRFCMEIDDYVQTLLLFDVLNVDDAMQPELLEAIKQEGVVLYEKV